jgi:predicted dehydrogenase
VTPVAAIVGAGLMGRWHAHAVRRLGGRVALVVDPWRARGAALAARVGAASADWLDPARVAELGAAAHVCTPLDTHAEVVASLVAAGVHVLVEKPLTETADTTADLLARAQEHGVVLCPVHQFSFQEGVRRLVATLPSLGPVRHVDFTACTAGAAGRDAATHDALVADVLPHPLSLFARVLGVSVDELEWRVSRPHAGELRAFADAAGTHAALLVSTHGRPTTNTLRVIGERGTATADLFHGFAIVQPGDVSRGRKIAQPFMLGAGTVGAASANLARRAARREPAYPGLRELVRVFYDAVAGVTPPPISPAETLAVARARDRICAASRRS